MSLGRATARRYAGARMTEALMHGALMLGLSICALWIGPALHRLADKADRAFSLLDGFVVVAVLGLALLEIIPTGIELAGWWAALAMFAGVLLPKLAEQRFGGASTHKFAAWLAFGGMALHALTDGLALAGTHVHGDSHALEWAVILHRVPVGLAVWWMLVQPVGPKSAQRAALLALATVTLATIVGFSFGGVLEIADGPLLGAFEAFVGGLLLHVVSHGIGSGRSRRAAAHRWLPGIGGLVGLGFVLALFVVPELDEGHGRATLDAFWQLLLDSAPALLLAYGLAGVIGSVMGEAPARWLRRGSKVGQALRGVAFGLPLPLCSCGVVPVYRSLVDRKVPAAAALGFLVATPELGLDAVLISLPLLGAELALLRIVVAFVLALVVGWVVGAWADRLAPVNAVEQAEQVPVPVKPLIERLRAGLITGYGEVLDSTGPWILVGLLIAAFVQPWLDPEALTALGPLVQVAAFALIGLPVYVCATGATPLVAVLIAKGLSPGAALAFLLTGPATNATTFGVLEQLHGRKIALAFAGTVTACVLALGCAVNLLWPSAGAGAAVVHAHAEPGWLAVSSAIMLGLLFMVSLIRQGPRGFLGRLWEQAGHHDHDGHDHDGHDHDQHHAPEPTSSCGGCCH